MRDIAIAIVFVFCAALGPAAIALAPGNAGPVAVIAPPWAAGDAAAQLVAGSDGALVATAHSGRIAIARFDTDGFVSRLYRAGALLVIDATAVTACLGAGRKS